jgi:mannose-6-phosphate isomerase-like protein (cupin superfamily)
MPASGRTWKNPRTGAWVTWLPDGDDGVLERVMKPHTGKADPHVHLDYVESFEIIAGTATIEVDGRTVTAGPGERVELSPGTGHRNPYNASDSDLRLRHRASPSGTFVESFVSALGHHMENDTVNEQGEFSDLQLFVVLHGTRAKSYRVGIPVALQKPVVALGAFVGRRRGLRPTYE